MPILYAAHHGDVGADAPQACREDLNLARPGPSLELPYSRLHGGDPFVCPCHAWTLRRGAPRLLSAFHSLAGTGGNIYNLAK